MLNILKKILSKKSLTPHDKGCQRFLSKKLKNIGFEVMTFKKKMVTNSIFFYKINNDKFDLLFSGHTDVVKHGKNKRWIFYPYGLYIKNGKIFSRGICDMKGSIFCFVKAIKLFLKKNKKNICVILTSDEEGKSKYGTKTIVKILKKKNIYFKYSLIGEPTSEKKICDTIKIGRRGSFNFKIKIYGKQGHSAYDKKLINPVHVANKIIYKILNKKYFKTSFQVVSIKSNFYAYNITPSECTIKINIRYPNNIILNIIIIEIIKIIKDKKINYKFSVISKSNSYKSKRSVLNLIKKIVIKKKTIISSTKGGTSDGRFLIKMCNNIFELGLKNDTAHKINENCKIKDIFRLLLVYYNILITI